MAGTRNIIWDEEVLQDMEDLANFYDTRNGSTRYSYDLLNKFREAINQTALFPSSGHATEHPHLRYIIVVPEYSLFYHYDDEKITVIILWDNRRNPARLAYIIRNLDSNYLNEPMVPYETKKKHPDKEDGVLHFSPELRGRIDAALEQMQNGQTYTEEEVDKFFDEWLGKED